jgi:hypothetical protein
MLPEEESAVAAHLYSFSRVGARRACAKKL